MPVLKAPTFNLMEGTSPSDFGAAQGSLPVLLSPFTVPAIGSSADLVMSNVGMIAPGNMVWIPGAGWFVVQATAGLNNATVIHPIGVQNPSIVAPGTVVGPGTAVVPGGDPGTGDAAGDTYDPGGTGDLDQDITSYTLIQPQTVNSVPIPSNSTILMAMTNLYFSSLGPIYQKPPVSGPGYVHHYTWHWAIHGGPIRVHNGDATLLDRIGVGGCAGFAYMGVMNTSVAMDVWLEQSGTTAYSKSWILWTSNPATWPDLLDQRFYATNNNDVDVLVDLQWRASLWLQTKIAGGVLTP